jgi:FK506-binding protein 4/5
MDFHQLSSYCVIDGFRYMGKPAHGNEGSVPPNATLQITLELVSWKTVSGVIFDKKVVKERRRI